MFIRLDHKYRVIAFDAVIREKIKSYHKIAPHVLLSDLHKTLWKGLEKEVNAALKRGKTSYQEQKLRTKVKKNEWFLITIQPVAENSVIEYADIFFENIQAQKEEEKEKDLRHKMATVSTLASKLAHQLNNPLAAILNQIGALLLEDLKSIKPERLRQDIQTLQEQVYSLSILTNSFEAFTQEQPEAYRLIDIRGIVEKAIELVKLLELDGKIKYVLKIDKTLPYILGNEITLELCLINVLRNSIEAMTDGGTITVNAFMDKDENSVVIRIQDTGGGFQIDNLYRPFDPFFTTKADGHVGLGLTVAYNIISNHRGRIKLEKGNQTTVTLVLPVPKK